MFRPERLKECREAKSWSQEDVIFELKLRGISIARNTWSSWENGNTIPNADELFTVTKMFDKPMEYFFVDKMD